MNSSEIYKALSIKPASFSTEVVSTRADIIKAKENPKHKVLKEILTTDSQSIDSSTEDEGKVYKFPKPQLHFDLKKKDMLSEEDQDRLDFKFRMMKLAFYECINLLRGEGVDVSGMSLTKTKDRIDCKMPDIYRRIFEMMWKNNLTRYSVKARDTYRGLFAFTKQMSADNILKKISSPDFKEDLKKASTPPNNVYAFKRS